MCEPTSIAMAVMAIASTAVSYGAAQHQAHVAEDSAKASYDAESKATALQEQQINAQASDQMSARAMQAQAAEASLRVAAGESGLAGVSADRNERAVGFAASQDIATIDANRRASIDQAQANLTGAAAQAQSQINSHPEPNALAYGLDAATSATKAYYSVGSKAPSTAGAGLQINKEEK